MDTSALAHSSFSTEGRYCFSKHAPPPYAVGSRSWEIVMGGNTLVPFIWAGTGLFTLVVIVLGIYWAHGQGQFDEDIKNQIFSFGDDDRYGSS